jgi:gluconolactonase
MTERPPGVRSVAAELGFTEGPVFTATGSMIMTSITRGTIYRLEEDGASVLARTGGGPNGATEGPDGALYIAQNGGVIPGQGPTGGSGGVQVIRQGGDIEWLCRNMVTPNDLCFGPDGLLYVTDPTRPRERNTGRIWRVDPDSGDAELLVAVDWYPNGIGFGSADDAVYIAKMNEGEIVRCALTNNGLGAPEVVIRLDRGRPDGFAFDINEHLVIGAISYTEDPGEIQVWSLDNKLLDTLIPGRGKFYTNVALDHTGRLLISASDEGAALLVESRYDPAMPLHPLRAAL